MTLYCQGDMSTHTLQAHSEYFLGVYISLQRLIIAACEGEQGREETHQGRIQQILVYFGRASGGFAGFLYSVEKESSFLTQGDRDNLVQRAGQAIHTFSLCAKMQQDSHGVAWQDQQQGQHQELACEQ